MAFELGDQIGINVARGIAPDSDEYFAVVESALGIAKPAPKEAATEDGVLSAAAAKPERDTAPPAAPVSRGGPSSRSVRLSAEEIEMAEMSGVTAEEYARNKAALQKEGRMT